MRGDEVEPAELLALGDGDDRLHWQCISVCPSMREFEESLQQPL